MTSRADDGPALVLGATGFIGRWVVRELLGRGTPVVGVIRSPRRCRDVFGGWPTTPEFVTVDLGRAGSGRDVIGDLRPSVVFNLAGYGVDREERDERLAERLNAELVRELADACAPSGAATGTRLIHAGSALEYGTAGGLLSEQTTPEPTTLYGRTKLAGTLAITDAARKSGLKGVTARLFTVFGDGEHPGRLFPSLVDAAETGAAVSLTDGEQRRDFAWAGDVASLLVDLSAAPFSPGEIVNLATGRMHSVAAFIRACAAQLRLTNEQLHFGALPTRAEEMQHEGVAVERLQELVGYTADGNLAAAVTNALRSRLTGDW